MATNMIFDNANVLNTTILTSMWDFSFSINLGHLEYLKQYYKTAFGLLFSDCIRSIYLRFWLLYFLNLYISYHLVVFGFNLEKSENNLNFSERWTMEFPFFKKKVVPSA